MQIRFFCSIFVLCCFLSLTLSDATIPPVSAQLNRQPNYQILVKSLQGDTLGVRNLLLVGADPNTPPGLNDRGMTALMFAAWRGHDEIVALLTQSGASINATSNSGMTALMYAAFGGHLRSVQLLLGSGANPNLQGERGKNALMYAIEREHLEIARVLTVVSNNSQTNTDGDTSLQLAVKKGNVDIVSTLLTPTNSSLETVDNFGQTPLMNAARKGHTRIVIRLLNKGARVNARDGNGKTALLKALIGNHRAVVQVIRARGGTL